MVRDEGQQSKFQFHDHSGSEKNEIGNQNISDIAKLSSDLKIDKEQLEKLMEMPSIKKREEMRKRSSLIDNASWIDHLFFSWTYDII